MRETKAQSEQRRKGLNAKARSARSSAKGLEMTLILCVRRALGGKHEAAPHSRPLNPTGGGSEPFPLSHRMAGEGERLENCQ